MKSSDDLDRKMTSGSVRATEKEAEEGPRKRKMRTSNGTEEGAQVMPILPQEMVGKIVAMAPFPSIFKAVCLSRSWRARFSSISLLKDVEMERGPAAAFQKQVIGEWGKNWDNFCPVFVGKDHLVAYCQKSRNWQRFSLSFLPEMLPTQSRRYIGLALDTEERDIIYSSNRFKYIVPTSELSVSPDDLQINGALLYTFHQSELYVADILTQRWKQLPRRPQADRTFVVWSKVVSNVLLGTYKVVLFCRDDCPRGLLDHYRLCSHDHFSAQIYESNSRTWSTQNFSVTREYIMAAFTSSVEDCVWSRAWSAAHLNGIFYMVPFANLQHLLAFNLAEGTLEELRLSFINRVTWRFVSVNLLVCNDNRLMMVTSGMHPSGLQILRVDLHSLQLMLMHRGDLPTPFKTQSLAPNPVSDGNCIFFRTYQGPPPYEQGPDEMRRERGRSKDENGAVLLSYDVNEEAWSAIPIHAPAAALDIMPCRWIGASFQPSLSAFVAL